MRGAHCVVTGGTGYLGGWLVEALRAADDAHGLGVRLTLVSRDTARAHATHPGWAADRRIAWITADVRTLPALPRDTTHVIHAAAESSTIADPDDHRAQFTTVLDGTRTLLDRLAETEVRQLLFVSTGGVYGRSALAERLDEASGFAPDPTDVRSAYDEAKRAAELLVTLEGRRGLVAPIVRLFASVGPGLPLDAHFAVGNFLRDALAGGPITVRVDGTAVRSYLYAADVAAWCWRALFHGVSGRAYNVGAELALSTRELALRVAQVTELPPTAVRVLGEAPRDGQAQRLVPDTARARTELEVAEWIDIDDALRRTIAWHRATHD